MKTIYKNEVKSIGAMAQEFLKEKILILFGDEAPEGLKDYCYGVDLNPIDGEIKPGDQVNFNEQMYHVSAVGSLVQKNLVDLGHITMKFDGSNVPGLAGTLYLEDKAVPQIHIGTKIEIKRSKQGTDKDKLSTS